MTLGTSVKSRHGPVMQHVVVRLHLEELTVVGRSVTYVRLCPVMSDEAASLLLLLMCRHCTMLPWQGLANVPARTAH